MLDRLFASLAVSEARNSSAPMSRAAAWQMEQRLWIKNDEGQYVCRLCNKRGDPPV